MIKFSQDNHQYESIDPQNAVDWIGITSFVGTFKQPFNAEYTSEKVAKNTRSKWYGKAPSEIREIWNREGKRSLELGNWFHSKEEVDILSNDTYKVEGQELIVIRPLVDDDAKYAPDQLLKEGHIYPEHFVYLQSSGICGQSDRVEVLNTKVNVRDYKTSKVIKTEGFTTWEGITQRMTDPISHLDDCHIVHYSLQLSLYLYMILKHNPQLTPGILMLDHIIFEQDGEDEYGYPLYKKENGNYIIKDINQYKIPYLKTEVISMLTYLKDNRELVKARIKLNKN